MNLGSSTYSNGPAERFESPKSSSEGAQVSEEVSEVSAGFSGDDVPEEELWDLQDFVELLQALYWLEPEDMPEEMDELREKSLTGLWEERKTAKGLLNCAKRIVAAIDGEISRRLGPVGTARLDDYQVRISRDRRVHVLDPDGLAEWLGNDWEKAVNLRYVRTSALRQIAEDRGLDPDEPIDSFLEIEEGDARLTTKPIEKAPKYVSKMGHGETRGALE